MTTELLNMLHRRRNARGLVMLTQRAIDDELKSSSEDLGAELQRLEEAGEIETLSPPPFLVVRLRKWSGRKKKSPKSPQNAEAIGYSYSFHQSREPKAIAIAGRTSAHEELLREILEALGESDPSSFRGVLTHYPPSTVRAVLNRVRATPPEKIRKSRTALFRHLLANAK